MHLILFLSALMLLPGKIGKPDREPYYVKMKGFKVTAFNLKKIEIASTAVFFNTYPNKAKLEVVDINVWLDGKLLGKVVQAQSVSIPKESAFDVPLLLKLEPPGPAIKSAIWQGGKLLTGGKSKLFYQGFIKIKVIGFIPIKIPIEDKMDISIKDMM